MPALPEEMYCSEQISIPPAFPYLLRQYAKAAIRTQPIDLLKWSTAYFRCLSLNIPPPVKPRLEYPIPRDFHGITPGWLKALMYQLQNNLTIPFKILWDRWIGACLEHKTLIQLLCLGGFEDPQAIPWLRFVAVCAGTLTDDLTHTMILICEILTEEPEGGSAMIPLETFLDLYKFLARIDASKDQMLKNFWFRDSLLSLWREKVEKEEIEEEVHEEIIEEPEQSLTTKTSSESVAHEEEEDQMEKVVSCPSLPEDDQYSLETFLKDVPAEEVGECELVEKQVEGEGEEAKVEEEGQQAKVEEDEEVGKEEKGEDETEETADVKEEEQKEIEVDEFSTENFSAKTEEGEGLDAQKEDSGVEGVEKTPGKDDGTEVKEAESVESIEDNRVRDLKHVFDNDDDATLKEDLERLRALQQELQGETDEELEKFKCRLIEEMPLTESQEEGIKHFKVQKQDHFPSDDKLEIISGEKVRSDEVSSESQENAEEKKPYEELFVEALPGIGGIVPDALIKAVEDYMKKCAKIQHGIVMPRNIRHYSCPPLEAMNC